MARKTEQTFQALLGNRKRLNEIDPRFITRDMTSLRGVLRFPYMLVRTILREISYEIWRRTIGKGARVKEPIFMVGVPHSGTSISMRLFAMHPDVVNKSEANTILQPMGYFDYENGDHVRTEADATPDEIERLHARFEFTRWRRRKPRIINKSPNNTARLAFLNEVFPDAYFIHVLRDGRAVVNSLIRSLPAESETRDRFKPWKERENPFPGVKPPNWRSLLRDNPIEQHALQWREAIRYALKTESELALRCLHIKYEELCEDPRGVMAEAYRFGGLRVTDEILERLPERLIDQNYKWKDNFDEDEVKLINEIQQSLLVELGYVVDDLDVQP